MGSKIKAFFQALWAKLNTDLHQLWEDDKFFVILFGAFIALIKFHQLIINYLVFTSKLIFDNAQKKSADLQQAEDQADQEASQLIDDAGNLGNNTNTPGDDWNVGK
jgi:hypothetical protein